MPNCSCTETSDVKFHQNFTDGLRCIKRYIYGTTQSKLYYRAICNKEKQLANVMKRSVTLNFTYD